MTKTEITNEQIAEALGWEIVGRSNFMGGMIAKWKGPKGDSNLPDFLNDLNACFKYGLYSKLNIKVASHILADAWIEKWSPEKAAAEICKEFHSNL